MKKPFRILVLRFSSLGDVALSVPVIMSVLDNNKNVHIHYVTPKFMHDIFPQHPRLELLDFDKKTKHKGVFGLYGLLQSIDLNKYDVIADLHGVLRTKLLTTASILRGKKVFSIYKDRKNRNNLIQGKNDQPLRHITEKYADVFRKMNLKVDLDHQLKDLLFESKTFSESIGLAPFARHQGKMYPKDKLKKVVEILSKSYPIIIFGDKHELETVKSWRNIENVSFCEGNNLKEELKIMSRLQLMLSMDSANMHLASLVGVPVVSVWGVTHPHAGFLGYGQKMESIIQDETCTWRPTSIYGKKLGPEENPTGFDDISPEMIVQKIDQICAKLNSNEK